MITDQLNDKFYEKQLSDTTFHSTSIRISLLQTFNTIFHLTSIEFICFIQINLFRSALQQLRKRNNRTSKWRKNRKLSQSILNHRSKAKSATMFRNVSHYSEIWLLTITFKITYFEKCIAMNSKTVWTTISNQSIERN